MNKLLFTLSLVVLVAVPAYGQENFTAVKRDELDESWKDIEDYFLTPLMEKCKNKIEIQQKIPKLLNETLSCLLNITMEYVPPFIQELNKNFEDRKMRIIFKTFCEGTDRIIECVKPFYNTVLPCFEEELEREKILRNIFTQLLEYICYNQGQKVRRYFSRENPLQCFAEQKEDLAKCFNDTLVKYYDIDEKTVNTEMLDENDKCEELRKIHNCTVTELEKCEDKNPSITIDDIFKILLNATSCELPVNGVNKNTYDSAAILLCTIFLSFIVKYLN